MRATIASSLLLVAACGGTAAVNAASGSGGGGASSSSAPTSTSSSTSGTAPEEPIVGELIATTASDEPPTLFEVNLQPVPTSTAGPCAGATATVGSCCVYPPVIPPPTMLPGDGGRPATESSAGTLTLVDVTSNAPIGTLQYANGIYDALPVQYGTPRWHAGDILRVSAPGDQIGAFTVSVPALIPPVVQFPATLDATSDLTITWQPDPNADSMTITLLDSAAQGIEVVCVVPDAQATVTVDASLFAAFKSGDRCQETADRETVRYAKTSKGVVAFMSFGWTSVDGSVQ